MAREKDPAEIIETIAQSIRVSQRGARRVRAHRFKELFGYQVLNSQRRERIERLMAEAGIEARASLKDAGRDDWLVMSMPVEVPVPEASPDPAPAAEWFAYIASVRTDTEREVRCTSPRRCSARDSVTARSRRQPGSGSGGPGKHPGTCRGGPAVLRRRQTRREGGRAAGARGVQAADQGREGTPGGSRPGAQLRAVDHSRLLRHHRRQDREPLGLPGCRRPRQGAAEGEPGRAGRELRIFTPAEPLGGRRRGGARSAAWRSPGKNRRGGTQAREPASTGLGMARQT